VCCLRHKLEVSYLQILKKIFLKDDASCPTWATSASDHAYCVFLQSYLTTTNQKQYDRVPVSSVAAHCSRKPFVHGIVFRFSQRYFPASCSRHFVILHYIRSHTIQQFCIFLKSTSTNHCTAVLCNRRHKLIPPTCYYHRLYGKSKILRHIPMAKQISSKSIRQFSNLIMRTDGHGHFAHTVQRMHPKS
jgi:hypothetical protein